MGRTMKEVKTPIYSLDRESKRFDEELYEKAELDALTFLREGCNITSHAYRMHANLSTENLGHNNVVSYFYGGDEGLTNAVKTIVKNSKAGIMNYLASRGFTDLEITRKFKKVIGVVYVGDEAIETRSCKIILSRDYHTGKLYTKTAYPILV